MPPGVLWINTDCDIKPRITCSIAQKAEIKHLVCMDVTNME